MESRRQRPARSHSVKKKETKSFLPAPALPHIAELIEDGEITVGVLRPIGCVATAADRDCTYAMLVRRKGESLMQLLTRLDAAIAKAYEENICVDEINPPTHV